LRRKEGDPEGEVTPPGVRGSIVVKKRRNGRGAKGARKVDAIGLCKGKTNRRQWAQALHKAETSEADGAGWNPQYGPSACWKPWKTG
jgi:hypothetical protein